MTAYYNEIDPFAAQWLRNLISEGHIAPGDVDERDIRDVTPNELVGYTQCHCFAGIGGWSYALRLAGWPDDRPVWTGSCPCQPFSAAGKGGGFDDERHLWPSWHWLIAQSRPDTIFGEQVSSADGLDWLDLVDADLDGTGYALGAMDTCAAGVGAPHIRQRLYWVADTRGQRLERRAARSVGGKRSPAERGGGFERLADADGWDARAERVQRGRQHRQQPDDGGAGWVGNSRRQRDEPGRGIADMGCAPRKEQGKTQERERGWDASPSPGVNGRPSPTNGFWRDPDWLLCRDGKWRPVEPGTQPLAHGIPGRMGALRGYGNAIVAHQAAAFISAYLETETGPCR